MAQRRDPILVVGAGPVDVMAALALACAGLEVFEVLDDVITSPRAATSCPRLLLHAQRGAAALPVSPSARQVGRGLGHPPARTACAT